jgi:outer membrane protein assembly factor BamB
MNARSFPIVAVLVSILVFAAALAAGSAAEARWATLGGSFQRAGLSQSQGPVAGGIRWQFETGGAVVGSVTVGAGGQIHVACEDGKLYTVDAGGKPLWVLNANCPLLSTPTIGPDGSLYAGGKDGRLFAVDPNGRLNWTLRTGGAIHSSPAVGSDGHVYVGSTDGTLYAVGRDGVELWRFKTRGPGILPNGAVFASPALGRDGTIYMAGLYEPNLYALRPADGSVKWVCRFLKNPDDPKTAGWPFTSPVVGADGTIYQTLLYDSHLYAVDPGTGKVLWSVDLCDPALFGQTTNTTPDGDGWSEPVLGPDGTIYVSCDDPYLRAVNPSGIVKWSKRFGDLGAFTLTGDRNNVVYAASDDGRVYVVAADGSLITQFETGGWPAFPVLAADGVLILADSKDYSSLNAGARNAVWAIAADGAVKP